MQNKSLVVFDPSDPFPLLNESAYSYEEAKQHSALVDEWMGFQFKKNSEKNSFQTWSHLSPQQYQTPYVELRFLLHHLQPQKGQTLVDLGCGFARLAFILERHYPGVIFKGFEIDQDRVRQAQEKLNAWKAQNSQVELQDLSASTFQIPLADFYFLFDYGFNENIQKTLGDLQNLARKQSITVVGRGRATRHFIQVNHPWLSQVNEPQHFSHSSIYKS